MTTAPTAIRAAAARLRRDAGEMPGWTSADWFAATPGLAADIEAVAAYALNAAARVAALTAEVERLTEALIVTRDAAFSVLQDLGNGKHFYAERDLRRQYNHLNTILAAAPARPAADGAEG